MMWKKAAGDMQSSTVSNRASKSELARRLEGNS
jgi:hypothetical protein